MEERLARIAEEEYVHLEDRFLELTAYVPLAPDLKDPRYHFGSPRAAEFGLDCGTWLETLMTELLRDPRCDEIPDIEGKRASPSIDAYREAFEPRFGFSGGGWSLKHHGGDEIRPFASWAEAENPEWFHVYSKYKHDRFTFADAWTMGHSLLAFCALTIVLRHWEDIAIQGRWSRVFEGVRF